MHEEAFAEIVERIRERDPRYDAESYFFLREALEHTSRTLKKPAEGERRHVTGQELLEGIRSYALMEYGPMALTLLGAWGVTCSEDFGHIVFNLVEAGILGRTDRDQRQDFANGYDFHTAFAKPYLPETPLESESASSSFTRASGKPRA
jgi:uncharacterized repeat protein (TIGR04138 family)